MPFAHELLALGRKRYDGGSNSADYKSRLLRNLTFMKFRPSGESRNPVAPPGILDASLSSERRLNTLCKNIKFS
jgi:hypothetical protein